MSAIVKVTFGEVESVYRCTYPLARALEVILHHSNCAEEIKQEPKTDVLDKIRDEIRKHCERYMDGDIIADEVIQAVENICKAESEEL
jgi:hypothetical protein